MSSTAFSPHRTSTAPSWVPEGWMSTSPPYGTCITAITPHHLPSVPQPLQRLVRVLERPVEQAVLRAEFPGHRLHGVVGVHLHAAQLADRRLVRLQVGPGRPGRYPRRNRCVNVHRCFT